MLMNSENYKYLQFLMIISFKVLYQFYFDLSKRLIHQFSFTLQ